LPPEDADAWELWLLVQTQWRVSFAGMTGLDYLAVKEVAAVVGIDWDEEIFTKIKGVEWHELYKQSEKVAEDGGKS